MSTNRVISVRKIKSGDIEYFVLTLSSKALILGIFLTPKFKRVFFLGGGVVNVTIQYILRYQVRNCAILKSGFVNS